MVRKRLDERVRTLIERGVVKGERSILVLVGDHGKDQVPNLHQILSKTTIGTRPNVLWCYKKELGFSTHRKKRIKKLKRDKARGLSSTTSSIDTADNFELFISSTDINWCYYKDSHRVLGTTVGMLVLQDFEALTPNLMARTIETVKGGGLVIFLMRTVKSLKQLYTMTMDVHARYRTESAGDVVPRFNERFILSLANCPNCLVCDDELNVLPISKRTLKSLATGQIEKGDAGEVILRETTEESELKELKESLIDTPHVGVLADLAKTLDQAKALLVFLEACSEKTHATSTVAMTAARGRGKSAAMGLCLAGAVSLGYSTIAVTAPEPENLVSVFDFLCRGLKALKYQEHLDYTVTYNTAVGREAIKCIVAINIHRSHRQVIQYIAPHETDKFTSAEIVAIDEAAAIPLPVVRALMHQPDRLTFLSSTVNGYEGTGRALSLKLIKELRESKGGRQNELNIANAAAGAISGPRSKKGEAKVHDQRYKAAAEAAAAGTNEVLSGPLREIELSMPIRYAEGDGVESWLNKLLCLDSGKASQLKLNGGAPAPLDCELYSVDRDALFSYHKLSEAFLQKLMGLYTSAHYKNTPNDLQMLSDAPAHSLFVLLSPSAEKDAESLPDILAVVQVALEGKISRKAVEAQLARGHRSAGDLIPWTISQQFGDSKFAQLSGARVVRIAVHPSVQSMGYGSRSVELLYRFYNGEMISLDNPDEDDSDNEGSHGDDHSTDDESLPENTDGKSPSKAGIQMEKLAPRKELPPLLLPLTEVEAPRLDWIGTSFGLTLSLHKFWSRAGMHMLYLRQTKNELTGEHSAIMLRALPKTSGVDDRWLDAFVSDTRKRYISLLSGSFRDTPIRLAISVLEKMAETKDTSGKVNADELSYLLTPHDMKRLELYGRNLCDHHLVTDLLPTVSRLYFTGRFGGDFKLSSVQAAILCGIGVQNHDVDAISKELGLPSNQVLAMFNKAVRKLSIALNLIVEDKEKESLLGGEQRAKAERVVRRMEDVAAKTLEEDAREAATDIIQQMEAKSLPPAITNDASLMQYAIKGTDDQWDKVLEGNEIGETGTVSIRSVREKRKALDTEDYEKEAKSERKTATTNKKQNKKKRSKK
ncbi:GNAT acetyltransferase 2 [Nitzschia inconspicua]|uniref:RNA cytidine acetyltransferase n=1 Tax=Nitzschia inconspicua TaxID=303405 RepID=A0A9K3KS36_9STRA|nr:GNAT acetyltransferase 2 [Nitzschia inconspicua]